MDDGRPTILLVEDNPGDARLIEEMLVGLDTDTEFRLWQASRLASGIDVLARRNVEVVLLDLSLPDSVGMDTLHAVQATAPHVPIIVLTGTDDQRLALLAVKAGAQDYLTKGEVDRHLLLRAIRYAMERKEIERALRVSEERYALAAAGANDGLWDWDIQQNDVYYSPRWKSMLGYTDEEIGNRLEEWFDRVHPDDQPALHQRFQCHQGDSETPLQLEYRMLHKDGKYRWMLCRGMAVHDNTGQRLRMAGSQTDIHERKMAEERLRHDVLHDALTGLPNRALLMDRLERALARAKRDPDRLFAVLFIDLDRFKNVNDSLGHIVGDKLLIEWGQRLAECCRPQDTLARLGGDEFVLLLEDISGDADAIRVAKRIQTQFNDPLQINNYELFISGSIGIALGSGASTQPEDLLRDADTAMYRAKAQGKACYSLFDADMHSAAVAVLHLEGNLRRAIERQSFHLHYQPVISLESGRIVAFEALVRWHDTERGVIPPTEFIPLAEETGMILPIGQWVLREACRQLRAWQLKLPGTTDVCVSVNLSCRQFSQAGLVEQIGEILRETGLDAKYLKLEVTESALMVDAESAARKLHRLREMGVHVSMDDFGTGYSSLSYLQRFPVDTLKIDQSFIRNLEYAEKGVEIVQAILNLGRALQMDVVAEGLESASQVQLLRTLGCPCGQGYFFSRPVPKQAAATLLRRGLPPRLGNRLRHPARNALESEEK